MISILALLPSLLLAQQNVLTPAEERDGWVLLFDGKTMDHWVDPATKKPAGNAWEVTPAGELHTLSASEYYGRPI